MSHKTPNSMMTDVLMLLLVVVLSIMGGVCVTAFIISLTNHLVAS